MPKITLPEWLDNAALAIEAESGKAISKAAATDILLKHYTSFVVLGQIAPKLLSAMANLTERVSKELEGDREFLDVHSEYQDANNLLKKLKRAGVEF